MPWLQKNVVSGSILAVFALALHLYIIPTQVESMHAGPVALSPSLFCHITAFLLLVLSLALVVSGFRNRPASGPQEEPRSLKDTVGRGAVGLVFSVLYIIFIEILGYFSSTVVFMIFFLYFSGVRSWKGTLVFLAVILPFIYLLFVKALHVVLPTGLMI